MLGLGALAAIAVSFLTAWNGLHVVDEGHVGLYWVAGALTPRITSPGYHTMAPWITLHRNILVNMQTDKVTNIPCGLSGGVLIYFDKVEVVNQLRIDYVYDTIKNYSIDYDQIWIYDKIHHELNQFCSKHTLDEVYISKFDQIDDLLSSALQESCNIWAPGIEIISIRVTKPRIPEAIRKNYEDMEAEKTKLMVSLQKQETRVQKAETERKRLTMNSQKELEVSKIDMKKRLDEQKAKLQLSRISNEMLVSREKALANARFYSASKETEAQQDLLTPEYIRYKSIEAMKQKSVLYLGDSIPNTLISREQL